jgi:hypothetical protein
MGQRICRLGVAALVASLACLAFASSALATFHFMGVREVKPSSSNNADDGYVELQMYEAGQTEVQNHPISIYDSNGDLVGLPHMFASSVANGEVDSTILMGESSTIGGGAGPDTVDPALNIPAAGGAACWVEASPPDCVSWGTFTGPGDLKLPTTAGTPAPAPGAGQGLRRDISANCPHLYEQADDTDNSLADFDAVTPNPRPNSVLPTETECVPPDTLIDTTPDSTLPFAVNSTSASFTFHASPASGATLSCKLDNNAPEACNGGSKSYSSLSEAQHTFQVTASNSDGADTSPATYTWTVDTSPPDTSITGGPTDMSTVASASASFTFSGGSSFECKRDSELFASCSSPKNYSSLGEGSHTFTVRAIDDAGNVDGSPASRTWTVDTVPPDTSITGGPAEGSSTQATTANFGFSSPDGGTSFQCKLDGAPTFTTCPVTNPTYSGLGEGSHTLQVRALDAVGNPDPTPATRTWTVDNTAPNTLIDTQPSNPTASTSASFTFHSSETNSTFQCRLDSSLPGDFTSCMSPKNYAGPLSESSHTFEVRAIDAAGNPDGSPASYTWTVNSAAPPETAIDTTPDATPPFAVSSTSASFTFHATPATGATFQCRLDSSLPGDFTSCMSPKNYAGPLSEGQHTFEVRATGPGGTDTTPASYTWTVDTTAPNTSINGGPVQGSSINATSASFPFSSPDGGTSFQCRLDSSLPGDFTSCTTPKNYAGPLNEGPHTFEVRATDDAGNVDQTPASRGWTIDLTPPDTGIDNKPTDPTTSTSASFTYHSSEPSGATFKCKLDAEVDFTSCPGTGKSYNGLSLGEHTFTVEATDAAGNKDASPESYTWEIQPPPAPPNTVITKAPKRKSKDKTPTTSFVSEPADGATFQCQVDSAAYKSCTSPYTTKKLKPGKHTIRVKAIRQGVEDPTPASASFKILR